MSKIIGIDLGTTNTCAAYVSNKIPRVVPTESGFNTMPSVVSRAQDGSVLVGQAAKEQMLHSPERTVYAVKRLVGRQFGSRVVQELRKRCKYSIVADGNGEAAVKIGTATITPTEIQADILRQVKRYAEIHLGEDIPDVVIAVPAYYSDHQRALVKQAGERAGWTVRRVVNEPTAAALAYGFNRGFDQRILIYDLGGGTFDVSILEISGNIFQVIATGGDTFLGGVDFDNRIIQWMLDNFHKGTKIDLTGEAQALQRVQLAAERAKIELSILANTQLRIPGIVERRGKPVDLEMVLDRDTLNTMTRDLVDRTLEVIGRLLKEKSLTKESIDEVILVGGQTRMPQVVDRITQYFGKAPRKGVHPDECVALGAALLGDSLAKIDAVTLIDALSVPIGVARSGSLHVLIDKHTQLPCTTSYEVPTTQDNQTSVQVEVFQGEPGPTTEAEYLGTLTYDGLPPGRAGELKVQVDLSLDAEGMLSLVARDNRGGGRKQVTLATVQRPFLPEEAATPASTDVAEPAEDAGRSGGGLRGLVTSLLKKK